LRWRREHKKELEFEERVEKIASWIELFQAMAVKQSETSCEGEWSTFFLIKRNMEF
jgi:hypothetical protein